MPTSKKTIIILVISILVGITAFIYIFSQQRIKDEPIESVLKSIDLEGDNIIFGKIMKTGNDEMALMVEEGSKSVAIKIDNDSKIYKMNQKEEGQYKEAVEEFSKKIQEQMENPSISVNSVPPDMFVREEVGAEGLSMNQQVQIIIGIEGDSIRAKEIFIQ